MTAARRRELRGELRRDEPMSRHTSLKVGGPAELFFRPADVDDLAGFLRGLDAATPVYWLGLGSNLLVRDGGIAGAVIATAGVFGTLERTAGFDVRAGAGVPCTRLARQCVRWGLGPCEFFAGIPGTLGGALAMNAGAHGGETWDRVRSVRTIDRGGELRQRGRDAFDVGYRHVAGPADEWFVEARLAFDPGTTPSRQAMQRQQARRRDTQPLGLPSCGSVFRNPPGDHAARLIEASGLKGYRVGGAEVSDKHANFIINRDRASAAEVERLIRVIRETVRERHGVELVNEVRIVGREAQ